VDRLDKAGRRAVIQIHLKRIRVGADVKPEHLAGLTPGFSGADLANLVNEADLLATRRGADAVAMDDLLCGARADQPGEGSGPVHSEGESLALDAGAQRLLETETLLAEDIPEVVKPDGEEADRAAPGAPDGL